MVARFILLLMNGYYLEYYWYVALFWIEDILKKIHNSWNHNFQGICCCRIFLGSNHAFILQLFKISNFLNNYVSKKIFSHSMNFYYKKTIKGYIHTIKTMHDMTVKSIKNMNTSPSLTLFTQALWELLIPA